MALLNLFYQGNQGFSGGDGDGTLWYQGFDGSQWHGVQHLNIGGSANLTCAPSPVLWRNIPHIMHQGSGRNGQLWATWYDGSIWRPDQQVPGVGMSWSPSAVVFNNNLYVFHSGYAENGELWYTVADGTSWSQDHQILSNNFGTFIFPQVASPMSLSPSAVVWNNVIYVFFQNALVPSQGIYGNPGGGALYFVASTDGIGWENVDGDHQPTRLLPNVGMSFSPSAVVWRNMIHVFHEGYQQNGELWYSYHDGTNWHPDQQVPGVFVGHAADPPGSLGLGFFDFAPTSPTAVVYNNNCYVFYLNRYQVLSYVFADGTKWSQEAPVLQVPTGGCGWVGCAVW